MRVRPLTPDDATSVLDLRREALASAPLAFSASPQDDRGSSLEFLRTSLATDDNVIFGGFDGERLVGMVGLVHMEKLKLRHRCFVWGMFVKPAARGTGLGRGLLRAAVERARSWEGVVQVHLSVTEGADEARRLYEQAGFREWGVEPRSLHWNGRTVDEHHLVLDLDGEEKR